MDAALGLGLGHPLDPVHAAFEAEQGVGALALHLRHHFLDPALIGFAFVEDVHLESPALGEPDVHAEHLPGEQRGLLAAGAGAHFQDDVAGVLGVPGHQQMPQAGLALQDGGLELGDLHLRHFAQPRVLGLVSEDALGLLQLLEPVALEVPGLHHRLKLGAQLGQLAQPLHVADHGGVLELGFDFLELGVEGFKLVEHGVT